MKDEKKKLMKAKMQIEDSYFSKAIKSCLEGIFLLFYHLLKNPLENFWFECISVSIQYFDMLLYLTDKTVCFSYNYIILLVFAYLEANIFN